MQFSNTFIKTDLYKYDNYVSSSRGTSRILTKYSTYLYLNGSKSALYKNWFGVRWVKEAVQKILAALDFAFQRLFEMQTIKIIHSRTSAPAKIYRG